MNLIPDGIAMNKYRFTFLLFFTCFFCQGFSAVLPVFSGFLQGETSGQDTAKGNQILYNGRIWRNLYAQVRENQFLFAPDFLTGSVTIRGKVFDNVSLKYDIFKDELLTTVESGGVLQLNKEMVDSFSVLFQDKMYRFIRIKEDSTEGQKGYFNILYKGKTALYLKYFKKIDKLSVNGENEKFYQFNKLYFAKDNKIFQITGKNDLLNILKDQKELIKSYIKKNNIKVSEKEPETFIPVIRYFDSISQ